MSGKRSARRKASTSAWVVLKFGGTSVSSPERWETIAGLLRQRQAEGLRPVIVHSALATVSNKLDELLHRALEADVTAEVAGIRELHLRLAAGLQVDGEPILVATVLQRAVHGLPGVDDAVGAGVIWIVVRERGAAEPDTDHRDQGP